MRSIQWTWRGHLGALQELLTLQEMSTLVISTLVPILRFITRPDGSRLGMT